MADTVRSQRPLCVISGGTSGIGLATGKMLLARGYDLVLIGHSAARGRAALQELQTGDGDVQWLQADLASQSSVRELAGELAARCDRINVLVNCAGVVEPELRRSPEGVERSWAINHLAPFMLTNLLVPQLRRGKPARVVVVSSQVHAERLNVSDLDGGEPYFGLETYRGTKLANILFTRALAGKLDKREVSVNCLHPGVVATSLLSSYTRAQQLEAEAIANGSFPVPQASRGLLGRLLRRVRGRRPAFDTSMSTVLEAAERLVFLVISDEVSDVSGQYFAQNQIVTPAPIALDEGLRGLGSG